MLLHKPYSPASSCFSCVCSLTVLDSEISDCTSENPKPRLRCFHWSCVEKRSACMNTAVTTQPRCSLGPDQKVVENISNSADLSTMSNSHASVASRDKQSEPKAANGSHCWSNSSQPRADIPQALVEVKSIPSQTKQTTPTDLPKVHSIP